MYLISPPLPLFLPFSFFLDIEATFRRMEFVVGLL